MIHYQNEHVTLHHGDCLDVLKTLEDNSVDAVVTDPPYGIGFMGHEWDQPGVRIPDKREGIPSGQKRKTNPAPNGFQTQPNGSGHGTELGAGAMQAGRYDLSRTANHAFQEWVFEWATECYRVLKPGSHILAFGGSRTWHRLQSGIEDAGFEIRDSIAWLYGTGFPKSLNLNDDYEGWGTGLKPSFEPIAVGRKPLEGTVAENVLKYSTGALNIEATRVPTGDNLSGGAYSINGAREISGSLSPTGMNRPGAIAAGEFRAPSGRWPTNVVLDESQAEALDEQAGERSSGMMRAGTRTQSHGGEIYGKRSGLVKSGDTYGDSGGASRFFPVFPTFYYHPKASKAERPHLWRHACDCEHTKPMRPHGRCETCGVTGELVQHPTVKPLKLMQWLCRLVTPKNGVILELFAGSGTTIEAALLEDFSCVAIEREADYLPLIVKRITKPLQQSLFDGLG